MHNEQTLAGPPPVVTKRCWLVFELFRSALVATTVALDIAPLQAQDGPPGITIPVVLPPFVESTTACSRPPGLNRVLGFAQDNEREFMQGAGRGLAAAA